MAKSTTLAIKIVSDASGAKTGLDDAANSVGKFKSGLDKASVASGAVLGGLTLLGKQAFDAASDLQQASGAVEAVFGKYAASEKAMAADAAEAFGLSAADYSNSAALIGAQLSNMGMSMEETVGRTEQLIGLGADLAAQYGGTTAEAVDALSSALKGERDPIERYAVSLTQAAIDAQVAAMGLDTSTDAAKRNADATATLAIITAQTASAQGAFGREADTAAGQQQRATAAMDNAAATIGQILLPVVASLAEKLAAVANWASQNKGVVIALTAVIGGMAAATLIVNAAMTAWTTITRIAAAAQWLWNAAMSANPIGLIIAAVALVIAGIVALINHFGGFQNVVKATGQIFSAIWNGITTAIGWVWDKIQALAGVFQTVFGAIVRFMQPALDVIKWIADKVKWVLDKIGAVGSFIGDLFGAPAPAPSGGGRGLFGAGAGMRTAGLLTAGGGGTSPAATSGAALGGTVVNVTVNGALDPVAVGRQIRKVLADYDRRTGGSVAVPA